MDRLVIDVKTIATLRLLAPTHAAQLARDDRRTVAAREAGDGIELHVNSDIPAVVVRIKGLGFFGLMASQEHHRQRHLMMARGKAVYGY